MLWHIIDYYQENWSIFLVCVFNVFAGKNPVARKSFLAFWFHGLLGGRFLGFNGRNSSPSMALVLYNERWRSRRREREERNDSEGKLRLAGDRRNPNLHCLWIFFSACYLHGQTEVFVSLFILITLTKRKKIILLLNPFLKVFSNSFLKNFKLLIKITRPHLRAQQLL